VSAFVYAVVIADIVIFELGFWHWA